jgi:hypothetical protein
MFLVLIGFGTLDTDNFYYTNKIHVISIATLEIYLSNGFEILVTFDIRALVLQSITMHNFDSHSLPSSGYQDLSPGVKKPGSEADHSPPSSAQVNNAWSYTSTHRMRTSSWRGG